MRGDKSAVPFFRLQFCVNPGYVSRCVRRAYKTIVEDDLKFPLIYGEGKKVKLLFQMNMHRARHLTVYGHAGVCVCANARKPTQNPIVLVYVCMAVQVCVDAGVRACV